MSEREQRTPLMRSDILGSCTGLSTLKVAHVKAALCDFHDRRLPRQRLQVPLRLLVGVFITAIKTSHKSELLPVPSDS
jgi:hypothetical protein